jgi:sigma-B regulation protein RsbU (phosphoserine phosphatase)
MSKTDARKKNRKFSLRIKSVAVILIAAVILSAIAVTISYHVYSNTMDNHYKAVSSNIAKTAATQLNAADLLRYYNEVKKIGDYDDDRYWGDEAYRAEYDKKADAIKDNAYYEMLDTLFDIKDSNDVLYLYVQKLDEGKQTCTYLFDADRADDRCQLGTTHEISGPAKEIENPEYGIPAFITNETYGWLCSSIEPVFDEDGNPVALVGADVSMDEIMKDRADYLRAVMLFMTVAVIIICIAILFMVNSALVKPINMLSDATSSFVENRSKDKAEESDLSKLNIRSGDEVETLSESIKQMEKDINEYITSLTEVTAEKERIGAELNLAQRIQADMLPNIFPAFPDRKDFDIYASMTPAKEVGGDFYDFFLVDDTHLALVMADVSGKGVPAALFMMMSKILIQNEAMSGKTPAEALTAVNERICANNREEMFVTVWLGIIDLDTGLLTAANAGHEKPIIKAPDGDFEFYLDKHGFVIGGMPGIKYKDYEIKLEKRSKLFIYTDGVAEATSESDELFGIERTVAALNKAKDGNPESILESVKKDVDSFVGGAPQFDDLTMLCFEFIGAENSNNRDEITFDATLENVSLAIDFVNEKAQALPFTDKDRNQIDIAVDEIVSNVARYAYSGKAGKVTVKTETDEKGITITVIDSGKPYNPLEKEDPDVTLSAEERGVGGYGIFIVKKVMDKVSYEYKDGKNILTMREDIEA